jgi:endonuclease YncB( thermonuclease family)
VGWLAASVAFVGSLACADAARRGVERYDRDQLEARLADPGEIEFDIGSFPLKQGAVVDGDTLKVGGLEGTLRLLGLDTEETFKSEKNRREYEEGWSTYLAKKKAESSRPVKIATPLGEDAKHFAEDFFRGVRRVRLERDHAKEIRGRYNRFLAYVFVDREGEWVNYNVEAVRAGMSPYFTKYGYSRRFHDAFIEAQKEAQAAKRGVWSEQGEHYDDYAERLRWWNARADFTAEFEREAQGREDMVVLTHWDAPQRLERQLDREVEVLATVGDIKPRKGKAPARVMLSRRLFADMPLIFWDEEVLAASRIEVFKGEFVRVKGLVTAYTNKHTGERVRLPGQVRLPSYLPPGQVVEEQAKLPTDAPDFTAEPSVETRDRG